MTRTSSLLLEYCTANWIDNPVWKTYCRTQYSGVTTVICHFDPEIMFLSPPCSVRNCSWVILNPVGRLPHPSIPEHLAFATICSLVGKSIHSFDFGIISFLICYNVHSIFLRICAFKPLGISWHWELSLHCFLQRQMRRLVSCSTKWQTTIWNLISDRITKNWRNRLSSAVPIYGRGFITMHLTQVGSLTMFVFDAVRTVLL